MLITSLICVYGPCTIIKNIVQKDKLYQGMVSVYARKFAE